MSLIQTDCIKLVRYLLCSLQWPRSMTRPERGCSAPGTDMPPGLFILAVFFFFKTLVEDFAFSQFGEKSFA
jgi:hypothetical protein